MSSSKAEAKAEAKFKARAKAMAMPIRERRIRRAREKAKSKAKAKAHTKPLQLTQQAKAGIVWEHWFRTLMNVAAVMSLQNMTQIICAYYGSDKVFVYESDYDGNGVVHWINTHYGTKPWRNQLKYYHNSNEFIAVHTNKSSWRSAGTSCNMIADQPCNSELCGRDGVWVSIRFMDKVMVRPTQYTLGCYTAYGCYGAYPRSWAFEGSTDGKQWTLIKEHADDETFDGNCRSHT